VEGEREAVKARDFDAIVGPWIEPGYRLAVAMLRDPDEAQDAVQEAAVKAWRSLERLRDSDQARAWFLSIVANQCRSTMRRRWWSVVRLPSRDAAAGSPEEPAAAAGSPEEPAVQYLDLDRAMPPHLLSRPAHR